VGRLRESRISPYGIAAARLTSTARRKTTTDHRGEPLAGRRSTARIHPRQPSAPRTRPHHSCRSSPPIELAGLRPRDRLHPDRRIDFLAICFGSGRSTHGVGALGLLQPDQEVRTELDRWFFSVAGSVDAITAGVLLALARRLRRTLLVLELAVRSLWPARSSFPSSQHSLPSSQSAWCR
jgi:hypothetical protein